MLSYGVILEQIPTMHLHTDCPRCVCRISYPCFKTSNTRYARFEETCFKMGIQQISATSKSSDFFRCLLVLLTFLSDLQFVNHLKHSRFHQSPNRHSNYSMSGQWWCWHYMATCLHHNCVATM